MVPQLYDDDANSQKCKNKKNIILFKMFPVQLSFERSIWASVTGDDCDCFCMCQNTAAKWND